MAATKEAIETPKPRLVKGKELALDCNGKTALLHTAFPMRLKDWKDLEKSGLSLSEPDGSAEGISKLILHFCVKANPEITMDDIDELTMAKLMEAVTFIQEQSATDIPDPS
jgi:hypothetical protein